MALTSLIEYVQALDTSATDGSGKTGLAFGDITAKYLKQGGTLTSLTTETITTLGTYQAPTSNAHIRIKELANTDPTKGIYEVHFHDDQVASAGKRLRAFFSATGARFIPLGLDLLLNDVKSLNESTQSLTDLKDLADTGYDPATHKIQGVVTTDTVANTGTLAGAATVVLTDASLTAAKFGTGAITSTVLANDAITDAKVASDVTIASVTGAVGSVTGAVGSVTGSIGGNVTGSVGSVVGAVGSVTGNVGGNVSGSVASVVGNIGGNLNGNVEGSVSGSVSGSVGSVTGAVGSVTGSVGSVVGNVGGNVVGSTASVAGAVGSVTGNVGGDVQGKVLGGGSGTISGDGVRASSVTGAVGSVTGAVGSVTGSVGTVANPANIADAVWDEAQADHITSGTFGEIATEIAALPNAAANAAALLDLSNGIETSITPRQALRLILAAAAGKLSGAATTTVVIRNVGDTKDRITATVSSEGNRTAVSVDAT